MRCNAESLAFHGSASSELTKEPFLNDYLKATIYNIVILVPSVIKFLDRNFLFIEKV